MPTVFQPGERAPQPLDPDGIIYTTAQKVGNILQISPADPVDLTQDASGGVTEIEISPIDFRAIGFEVGDVIEIESDATLVEERTIASINLNTGKVRLVFTGGLSAAHTTANNATVRNTAIFTNGKLRGVSRDHVEHLIKVHQDRIDNLCNNSWRPMLQTAEFKNFDTYKPYRRRYYTDYVGTTPLLFRNVRQILRLEVWQGDDYKELAAAEARLKVIDHAALTGDSIYLCSGGGGIFTLSQGATASTWDNGFDNSTAAQQIADLINKDDRRNKSAIAASPSYSLEDSYSSTGLTVTNVHHEFLASANAEYGNARIKISSMRRAQGGQTSTLAVTDLTNIEVSQTGTNTTTSTSVAGTTVNVASTSGCPSYGLLMVGSGTSVAVLSYTGKTATSFTGCANVSGTPLTTLAVAGTTVFQYHMQIDYQGSTATGDEGRLKDWWFDPEMGIIYFNNSYPFFEWNAVKVTYVYGERYVEKAIDDICTKLVAMDLLTADDRSVLIPEGTTNIDLGSKYQLFKQQVAETLPRYVEVVTLD
tara:strand:+ start:21708 stop:23309 length:1602 start_codon:yes stop_codon:yes gene_type:complete